jgi:phage shock protein PspC (stress-responsive transcriptional regulator)
MKKLYRIPYRGVIAGVCAGLAEYFNVDVLLVRMIFILALIYFGVGIVPYLILWLVMPIKFL